MMQFDNSDSQNSPCAGVLLEAIRNIAWPSKFQYGMPAWYRSLGFRGFTGLGGLGLGGFWGLGCLDVWFGGFGV